MKFYNLDDLIRQWNTENQDWIITLVDMDSPWSEYIKEEPHHVTDNFNEQYQAG